MTSKMINGLQTKCAPLFSSVHYSVDTEGPIIVSDHLKSPENIGHIIRLASNFGCSKVIFVGDEDGVRHTKIKRVAGAAAGQVEWQFCNAEDWRSFIPEGYTIVALETTENSKNIASSTLPKKMVLLLGNEISGLSAAMLKHCSNFYHIPMIGAIKSMNVSQACSVALYEWVRQNLNTKVK